MAVYLQFANDPERFPHMRSEPGIDRSLLMSALLVFPFAYNLLIGLSSPFCFVVVSEIRLVGSSLANKKNCMS